MASVFAQADQQVGLWTPWSEGRPLPDGTLLRSQLYTVTADLQLSSPFTTLLTSDSLLLIQDQHPVKILHIQWKTLQKGTELPNTFTLKAGSGELLTFAANSEREQFAWLRMLSRVAICCSGSDYQQIRELGQTLYSSTSLCRRKGDGRLFTVKRVDKQVLKEQPQALTGLINEISIQRVLSHPHIVALHEVHEANDHIVLVRDFCAYGDIYKWIMAHKRFSVPSAARIMKQMLEALTYLHSNGILHRDIKLENILITGDDTCKLSDFGLAVRLNAFEQQCCGSPGYVAPEVLRRQAYGAPADVFSLGVVLFVLLSGRSPFTGKSAKEILKQNKLACPHYREKDWENVPRLAVDLVQRMLAIDPHKRITAERALQHHWIQYHGDGPLGLLEMPSPSPVSMASPPGAEGLTFGAAGREVQSRGRRHSASDALNMTSAITPSKEDEVTFLYRQCSVMDRSNKS